jgi:hypothetical protein
VFGFDVPAILASLGWIRHLATKHLHERTLTLPAGIDIVHFMQQDGNPTKVAPTLPETPRKGVTLIHLRDRWIETYANGTIEASSLKTCRIHFNHFCTFLGEAFPLNELKHSVLQDYVNKRSAKVGTTTIRKEIATLRGAWNWGLLNQLTEGRFPNRGLRYPKSVDKPVFMTFDEASRQIEAGGKALDQHISNNSARSMAFFLRDVETKVLYGRAPVVPNLYILGNQLSAGSWESPAK